MIRGHRIEKTVQKEEFIEIISHYAFNQINCTNHTFFRLSESQRKLFKCEELKAFLLEKEPILIGLQYNKNYAVFYDYKKSTILRIMLDISPKEINIITFYIITKINIPRI